MGRKVVSFSNLVLVCFTYFFIYSQLGSLISISFGAFSGENIVFLQFLSDLIILITISFLSLKLFIGNKNVRFDYLYIKNVVKYFAIMFATNLILSIPYAMLLGNETSNNEEQLNFITAEYPMYIFFLSVIFAPIVEEFVFRGAIYTYLRQLFNKKLTILISAGCFAILHFIPSIINGDLLDLIFLPSYLLPGIFLCLSYEKTKNIFVPVTIHAFNNLLSFIITISLEI